jgi:glucoamylase
LHWVVAWRRAGLAVLAAAAVGVVLVSGGSDADPKTPSALAGEPAPFLGTAVAGGGEMTAAVDAYGDVVDLRPSPAGPALIDNPAARQAAGTVPADTGIVPRVSVDGRAALPPWRADSVSQRYLPGTSVVRTAARFGEGVRLTTLVAAGDDQLAVIVRVDSGGGKQVTSSLSINVAGEVRCARNRQGGQLDLLCRVGRVVPPALGAAAQEVRRRTGVAIRESAAADRRWLARAQPLGPGAPSWARRMYRRSLLTLRALTDSRTGAVAAGARDGWAYAWPRDAATAALAFEAGGYEGEARQVSDFLSGLDLSAAARFEASGEPVPGQAAEGDEDGWVEVAERATATGEGSRPSARPHPGPAAQWRNRADYQEGEAGTYLGNAIAAGASLRPFETKPGLVRSAEDPGSGLDSAAAWAVRPFPRPSGYAAVRRTLLHLLAGGTPYGITPGEGWRGGSDPWMAPTAWSAWSLAALGDRRAALHLLADLRRAATPAGALPERVDARTGVPRSTTPLAWPHAFAILALRKLWPQ